MSNVAKLKKRAVEFEQKRQYDKALAEYLKVLEETEKAEDEVDVSLYNRVGDLMLRQSSVAEAVVYYEKAVDLYAEGGFFNNAIALCNKILRQAPGRHIIYYKLGKISAQKGFKSDAKQNFLEYADRMQQAGQIDEAFRALKEFADLCPDQDDIRLMLAEQLSRSDRKEEALEQLQSLYDKFELEGRRAEARATVDRMKAIDPDIELAQKGAGVAPPVAKSGDLIFLDVDEAGPGGFHPSRGSSGGQRRPSAASSAAAAAAAAAVPVPPAPPPPPAKPVARALADIPLLDVDFDAVEAAEQADWSSRPTVQSSAVDLPSEPPRRATRPMEPIDLEPPVMDAEPEPLEVEGLELAEPTADSEQASDSLLGFEPTTFDTFDAPPIERERTSEPSAPALEGFDTGRESIPSFGSSLDEGDRAIDEMLSDDQEDVGQDLPMLDLSESAPPSSDLPFLMPDDVFGRPMEEVEEEEPERRSGELLDDLVPPVSRRGSTPSLPMLDVGEMDLEIPEDDEAEMPPSTLETEVPDGGSDLPMLDIYAEAPAPPRASRARSESGLLDDGLLDLGEVEEPPEAEEAPEAQEPPEAEEPPARRRSSGIEAVLPEVLEPEPGEVTPAMLDMAAELDVPVAELEAAVAEEPAEPEPPPRVEEPPPRRASRTVDEIPTRRLTGAVETQREERPSLSEAKPTEEARREERLSRAEAPAAEAPAPESLPAEAAAPEPQAPRTTAPRRASRASIALPAIVAAVAAQQSVDDLREKVASDPENAALKRSFAEALLESGEREAGLRQLELALAAFEKSGDLMTADSVVEEILRVNPSSIRHYQKRVEIAFRLNERPRLVEAYVQLADGLFRTGQADKSRAVYQRVLDLAPNDARARAGIETVGEQEQAPAPAAKTPTAPERRPSAETKKAPAQPSKAKAPAPEPASDGGEDFVDLGEWLRSDDRPKSTRMVVEEKEPTGDEQADFADMLKKFKQGVAANVEDEDYDSHYDLGVAYKEMGLVDEAISQFQKALRGSSHRLRAYESLGYCFMEKQQYQVASTVLQRALHEPGLTDDQLVGVLYMLGQASESLGQHAEAVQYYQRVFAVDIDFQDVSKRLNKLEKVGR